MITKHSRRLFLAGAGGAALSLPLLPSLLGPSRAGAQTASAPRRFIVVLTSNGVRTRHFWPASEPAGFWRERATNVREGNLRDLPGPMSDLFGAELDPFREKMLLVRGLDSIRLEGGHLAQYTLSGWVDDAERTAHPVSVDQVIARSSSMYDFEPARRSLHQLVKPAFQSAGPPVSVTAGGTGVDAITRPDLAFQSVFSGFSPSAEPMPDPRTSRRLRVLDHVYGRYRQLRESSRIGTEDRARLDEHMQMLRDLEARVGATVVVPEACSLPTLAAEAMGGEPDGEMHLPAYTDAHIDVLAAAIKCDRTRVGILQLCAPTDIRTFAYLPGGPVGDHHGLSHSFDDESDTKLRTINEWYASRFARLLRALDVVEDPTTGATYLDNSIVYWGNECGGATGQESHLQWGFPVVLAGSGGGYLQTGRYVDYRRHGVRVQYRSEDRWIDQPYGDDAGRPYLQLLITFAQAFGLTPAEYEVHGDTGFGDYRENPHGYDLGDRRSALPFLAA